MGMSSEVVFLGADNEIGLALSVDGTTLADHTVITRAILEFGRGKTFMSGDPYLTIDSQSDASYFDFTDTAKLILKLGGATIHKGKHNVMLTIFTPAYTGGLVFDTELDMTVQ